MHNSDLIGKINNEHQKNHPHEKELTARIRSFELAYRMQQEAPECFEIDSEPEYIKSSLRLNEKRCSHFARQCLMARRMVERGVRFVQICSVMENAVVGMDTETSKKTTHNLQVKRINLLQDFYQT